jgi:hypothetical protein
MYPKPSLAKFTYHVSKASFVSWRREVGQYVNFFFSHTIRDSEMERTRAATGI